MRSAGNWQGRDNSNASSRLGRAWSLSSGGRKRRFVFVFFGGWAGQACSVRCCAEGTALSLFLRAVAGLCAGRGNAAQVPRPRERSENRA